MSLSIFFILMILIGSGSAYFITGTWPPLLFTKGTSMEPTLSSGDFFIGKNVNNGRHDQSIKTVLESNKTKSDIIVFKPKNGTFDSKKLFTHRAWEYTHKGENWVKDVNKKHLPDSADTCDENKYCPAPNSGYITKGDNNPWYDQVTYTEPIPPERVRTEVWIVINSETVYSYQRLLSELPGPTQPPKSASLRPAF